MEFRAQMEEYTLDKKRDLPYWKERKKMYTSVGSWKSSQLIISICFVKQSECWTEWL